MTVDGEGSSFQYFVGRKCVCHMSDREGCWDDLCCLFVDVYFEWLYENVCGCIMTVCRCQNESGLPQLSILLSGGISITQAVTYYKLLDIYNNTSKKVLEMTSVF